ncbi:hypothetical protein SAMD00019534_007130 [Acytostelium subglobosum LB1]|uniref:hypothetical protein n=1 Tax=Acytostelium subglobosum LB1 TaxID=1410327 RepID=UPI0006450609|nr:hypothetical protein SAMD00019534_007130 [Acytostelium subglobosum LB1]GAM17538.1 hypothetical protein SAMD00019534_007130 [Acytostelium subglobosum LB1]|eukprot:XP_012759600.1 hypothetical protein SAMD00019534_007130 [Acytostelium subglobosum LB1]
MLPPMFWNDLREVLLIKLQQQQQEQQQMTTIGLSYNVWMNMFPMPSSLPFTDLTITFSYDRRSNINRHSLPETLTSLTIEGYFDGTLEEGTLPDGLRHLSIKTSDWNNPITHGILPSKLETLQLGRSYDHPLNDLECSNSVTRVSLGESFNKIIPFESSLEYLSLDAPSPLFNIDQPYSMLKSLILTAVYTKVLCRIKSKTFPSLTQLHVHSFLDDYRIDHLPQGTLPISLEDLMIVINRPFVLPIGLKKLHLTLRPDMHNNGCLRLPNSITSLSIEGSFAMNFLRSVVPLPASLTHLSYLESVVIDYMILPPTIRSLTIRGQALNPMPPPMSIVYLEIVIPNKSYKMYRLTFDQFIVRITGDLKQCGFTTYNSILSRIDRYLGNRIQQNDPIEENPPRSSSRKKCIIS